MSSDGFADILIEFDPVKLLEKLQKEDNSERNLDCKAIIENTAGDEDKQYARDLFSALLGDFENLDYDYSYLNYDDDSLTVLRNGGLSSYAEIKVSTFESELKEFFNKYKDVITVVDITEELNLDGLYLGKIENRNENGEHFLVESAATITYENFTKM